MSDGEFIKCIETTRISLYDRISDEELQKTIDEEANKIAMSKAIIRDAKIELYKRNNDRIVQDALKTVREIREKLIRGARCRKSDVDEVLNDIVGLVVSSHQNDWEDIEEVYKND